MKRTLLLFLVPMIHSWVTSPISSRMSTRLCDNDSPDSFFLTSNDIKRLEQMRSRHKTCAIMILEAILPGQTIEIGSSDVKFRKLIKFLKQGESELGILGFNPYTGKPLNLGVTVDIKDIKTSNVDTVLSVTGKERFEVQGEPWLDETESFYLSDIECVEDRFEVPLEPSAQREAEKMFDDIPDLMEQWLTHSEPSTATADPLPNDIRGRAIWVASQLNPSPPPKVRNCLEIRPAMLACKNDYDRIHLAWAALQSSIQHLTGAKKLF